MVRERGKINVNLGYAWDQSHLENRRMGNPPAPNERPLLVACQRHSLAGYDRPTADAWMQSQESGDE